MSGNDNKQNEKNLEDNVKTVEKDKNDNDNRSEEWMLRPCDMYYDEYKDCRSIQSRFQQYFIYGENIPCQQWKVDYDNCKKWQKKNDNEAYNALLESEKVRRLERYKGNINNNVWKHREEPPDDWNEPLPKWLHKRNEGTYLASKQKQIDENIIDDRELYLPSCVII